MMVEGEIRINGNYSMDILSNGLRMITIPRENSQLAVLQITIKVGSMDDECNYGITHFLEHMIFQCNSGELLYKIRYYGGIVNACTYKDNMSISIQCLNKNYNEIVKLMFAFLFDDQITTGDMEKERKVIIEEIKGNLNSSSALSEMFASLYWEQGSLRSPVRGTIQSVSEITLEDILQHYNRYIVPQNIVIACGGSIEKKQIIDIINEVVSSKQFTDNHANSRCEVFRVKKEAITKINRDLLSNHIFIGMPAAYYGNNDLSPLVIAGKVLAGGVYSRLYEELRDKKALVYVVDSKILAYSETSCFLVYTRCEKSNEKQVIDIILNNIEMLKEQKISTDELMLARNQYEFNLAKKMELTSYCSMLSLELLLTNTIVNVDIARERFMNIQRLDIRRICAKYLRDPRIIIIGK